MCWNVFGRGIVLMVMVWVVLVFGAFFHVLENLTLYCVGVGVMGYVSMCTCVMCLSIFCNSVAIWVFNGMLF